MVALKCLCLGCITLDSGTEALMDAIAEDRNDALAVVNSAFRALGERNWDAFIGLVYGESLHEFKGRWKWFFEAVVRQYHAGVLEEPQLGWAQSFAPDLMEADVQQMPSEVMLMHYLNGESRSWSGRRQVVTSAHPLSPETMQVQYETIISRNGITRAIPRHLLVRRTVDGWRIELTEGLVDQTSMPDGSSTKGPP
jgi:hypothetical protein